MFDTLVNIRETFEPNEVWSHDMPWKIPSFAPAGEYKVKVEISGYVHDQVTKKALKVNSGAEVFDLK